MSFAYLDLDSRVCLKAPCQSKLMTQYLVTASKGDGCLVQLSVSNLKVYIEYDVVVAEPAYGVSQMKSRAKSSLTDLDEDDRTYTCGTIVHGDKVAFNQILMPWLA